MHISPSLLKTRALVGSALKTPAPCGAHTEMLQRAGRHLTPLPGHLNNADKDDRLHVAAKAIGEQKSHSIFFK